MELAWNIVGLCIVTIIGAGVGACIAGVAYDIWTRGQY